MNIRPIDGRWINFSNACRNVTPAWTESSYSYSVCHDISTHTGIERCVMYRSSFRTFPSFLNSRAHSAHNTWTTLWSFVVFQAKCSPLACCQQPERSPECWGYAELEQTWKYIGTQCCIICYSYRSIRKQIWPCHKNCQDQHRVIIWKKAPVQGHTIIWYKFWQPFKAFIIPIILYKFQKDPFRLII